MNEDIFIEKLAEVLDRDKIEIDENLQENGDWDSLSVLAVIDFFEQNGFKDFDIDEIHKCNTAKELYKLIK